MTTVRSFFGRAAFAILVLALLPMTAKAANRVHEKPSVFIKRHFGTIPKTQVLALDSEQSRKIKSTLGRKYHEKKVRYWQSGGKTAWILESIGKSELITAGFIIKNNKISELKVLVYRESHGGEVARPFFTKQFVGASLKGKRLDTKIDGIVGATLSVNALKKLSAVALYLTQQTEK